MHISLPLQSELVVVDQRGLSQSNVVPKSQRGSLFPLAPSGGSPWVIRGDFARGNLLGDPVSLGLSQHLDSLSGDPAERMWGMISLSSKGLFSSPRDSFGGQLNLSGALIVTAGVSGGTWDSLPLGVLCKLCTGQNLTLCFRLRCLRLCFRWILCLFWVGSLIHRRQILGVVESFQRLDGAGSTMRVVFDK